MHIKWKLEQTVNSANPTFPIFFIIYSFPKDYNYLSYFLVSESFEAHFILRKYIDQKYV